MQPTLLVSIAAAGGIGAVSRHLLDQLVRTAAPGLPLSTFVVNVLGHNLVGLLAMWAGIAAGGGASRG